jgi:hypothetical protein
MNIDTPADLVLRWDFDADDMRKLDIWMSRPETPEDPLKLYYVCPAYLDRYSCTADRDGRLFRLFALPY